MDANSLIVGVEEMKVPTGFARSLIGYGGDNIRLLQQVTGCRAYLEPAKDADGEHGFRILKIQGIPVQRAHCIELVQSHYQSEQQAKILKYDNHGANDPLFTAVKVALFIAEGEDELELAKIRSKVTQFARKCAVGVDVTGAKESLEMIIRRMARNFFASVCQTYYNKTWMPIIDFQLVLEAAVRELVDVELVASCEGGQLESFISQSHDLARDEKRFLLKIWELARPLFDGQKTRKTATYALETGRYSALIGNDEGSGTDRAENFLRQWVKGTLEYITLECGDPLALADEEKLTEVYACLLNTCNEDGASIALPQQWTCEALPPAEGWRGLVSCLINSTVVACRVRLQEKSDGAKASGKGKVLPAPPALPASPNPPGSLQDPMWRPKSAARPARGRPGPSAAPLPSPSAAPLRPAEPALPPRPAAVKAPEGLGLQNVFVRPRGNYGAA